MSGCRIFEQAGMKRRHWCYWTGQQDQHKGCFLSSNNPFLPGESPQVPGVTSSLQLFLQNKELNLIPFHHQVFSCFLIYCVF